MNCELDSGSGYSRRIPGKPLKTALGAIGFELEGLCGRASPQPKIRLCTRI